MIAPTDDRTDPLDADADADSGLAAVGVLEPSADGVEAVLTAACRRIAPVWPLDGFVAVNPYLGLADLTVAEAAATLDSLAGISTTMPIAWYLAQLDAGRLRREALDEVLSERDGRVGGAIDDFVDRARDLAVDPSCGPGRPPSRLRTVAEVARDVTGRDWPRLRTDRVSAFAAAHFDLGQAAWRSTDASQPLFAAWKTEAKIDRTPGAMGLRRFRRVIAALPDYHLDAAATALARLGVPGDAAVGYCHALLLQVGGWAAHTARLAFEADRSGGTDDAPEQFLSVLLAWEVALLESLGDEVAAEWAVVAGRLGPVEVVASEALDVALTFQDALDRSEQTALVSAILAAPDRAPDRPGSARAQVVFCIDVRSEVFRRHLETIAPDVETLGFAGFFGMAVNRIALGHDRPDAQCPVLLNPGYTVAETVGDEAGTLAAIEHRRRSHQIHRAWMSFKMGAVSCFSFVGPIGLGYLPKLFADGTGRSRTAGSVHDEGLPAGVAARLRPDLGPQPDAPGIAIDDQIDVAENALRAMSLTSGFAPVVLLVGHGSTTINNPYGAGLDCGACGGHSGETNARVAASILNSHGVREGLRRRGIDIPEATRFVAALHDTTTDRVTVFEPPAELAGRSELDRLLDDLAEAGRRARVERAARLDLRSDPGDPGRVEAEVIARSRDWAQVRPEWGLAGCRAFVAAPRSRSASLDLGGRVFLHSYDWRQDEEFVVLRLILNAPVVVASWINLQYYASTVDNEHFGSGNKTLHNVVGRLGVLEGHGGDLRVGLPMQSVHDGRRLQHEPLRLAVVIEAPTHAIDEVVRTSPHVRDLVEHGWIALYSLDDDGRSWRYTGSGEWR